MKLNRIALSALLVLLLFSISALADEAITVEACGSGCVKMQPDTAEITLGVACDGDDVLKVQSEANKRIAAIRQALIDFGVSEGDLSTSYVSICANYDYSNDVPQLTGYSATHDLTIKTHALDQAGSLIDVALSNGANRLDGVNYVLESKDAAYARALKLAVQDARKRAETMAQAENMTLGDVIGFKEQSDYGYSGYSSTEIVIGNGDADTQLNISNVETTATVSVTFALKK